MDRVWEHGLAPGIRAAGYSPLRIDQKEHIVGITDEIVAEIRQSRFLVAEYTEHKHGVYFEAGFAQGIGIPVFQTCRDTDLESLHFDVQHINTITWSSAEELAQLLQRRIRAILGDGPFRAR